MVGIRPIDRIMGEGLLSPIGAPVTRANAQPQPVQSLLGAAVPPSSYMAPQAASMPMRPAPAVPQPYDDAIMRNARGIGMLPAAQPQSLLGQTPAAPAEQQQTGLFGDFFGTSFDDPRTRRNLAGAAALLEAGGPQMRPVGTGQAVGMAINAMLGQQNEMDKLKKVTSRGFEARGPYVRKDTTDYLGEGVFSPTTGQLFLSQSDGSLTPMPDNAEPSTKGRFGRDIIGASGLIKQKQTVTDHEISLTKLSNYFNSQEGRQFGYKGIADRFVAGIKSILASDDPRLQLSPEQLSQKLSESQLQGLLGASRLDVVGGGVMTEQDALRVLAALGGDINAMQNPAIVEARIKEIYDTRYTRYENDLDILNDQLAKNLEPPRAQVPNFFAMPSGTLSSSAGDTSYTIIEGAD